ncbi:hypothetical protein JOB18_007455 [Solea senegalensis]|uniref:Uncharacterized protein n=1 Tax=Solea senegalensis TaxID=28829 RepID=A0AAV6QBT7_SOLSE|nr:hypothetical protein JOB18_007455 [Solea senegalensis]
MGVSCGELTQHAKASALRKAVSAEETFLILESATIDGFGEKGDKEMMIIDPHDYELIPHCVSEMLSEDKNVPAAVDGTEQDALLRRDIQQHGRVQLFANPKCEQITA